MCVCIHVSEYVMEYEYIYEYSVREKGNVRMAGKFGGG